MTATFKRIIIAAIALIAAAGVAVALVLSDGCSSSAADPFGGVRNSAVNAAIDLSGVKGRIDAQVRAKAVEAANEYGVPETLVDNVVDSLAIEDWQATSLPPDAVETGTYTVDTEDASARITTYDDPSIVTIDAYGQTVTMAVPDSAQGYVSYIKYLEYLQ